MVNLNDAKKLIKKIEGRRIINMDNGMIQNDNVMSKNKKGIFSKIFGGIGVALLMLIAYYAVQVVG